MPRRYTYLATCIKESPIRWGIELESLGDAVPPRVTRFANLNQPLTQSPYFQSINDPVSYFRQLVKGMPEMLRGYNGRILKQIQSRLDQLDVGECCAVRVSYIENGDTISPYNYSIEIVDTGSVQPEDEPENEDKHLPSAAPSSDSFLMPTVRESVRENESTFANTHVSRQTHRDTALPIEQLYAAIRQLQTDVETIKQWIAHPSGTPEWSSSVTNHRTTPEMVTAESDVSETADDSSDLLLNAAEQSAAQYIIDSCVATESQLRSSCQIENPGEVMARLIEKMEKANFPWITAERDRSGERVYIWNPPAEAARQLGNA